jgi:hypothetical protein
MIRSFHHVCHFSWVKAKLAKVKPTLALASPKKHNLSSLLKRGWQDQAPEFVTPDKDAAPGDGW